MSIPDSEIEKGEIEAERMQLIASEYHVKLAKKKKNEEQVILEEGEKNPAVLHLIPDLSLLKKAPYMEKPIFSSGLAGIIGEDLAYWIDYYVLSLPEYYRKRHTHDDFYNMLDKRIRMMQEEFDSDEKKLDEPGQKALLLKKIKEKITSRILSKTVQDSIVFSSIVFSIGIYVPIFFPVTTTIAVSLLAISAVGAFVSIMYNRRKVDREVARILEIQKDTPIHLPIPTKGSARDLLGKVPKIAFRYSMFIAKIPVIGPFIAQMINLVTSVYNEFAGNAGFSALAKKRKIWLETCCPEFLKLSLMPDVSRKELAKYIKDSSGLDDRKIDEKLKILYGYGKEKDLRELKALCAKNKLHENVSSYLDKKKPEWRKQPFVTSLQVKKYMKEKAIEKMLYKFQETYMLTCYSAVAVLTASVMIAVLIAFPPSALIFVSIGSVVAQIGCWLTTNWYTKKQKQKIEDQLDRCLKEDLGINEAASFVAKNVVYTDGLWEQEEVNKKQKKEQSEKDRENLVKILNAEPPESIKAETKDTDSHIIKPNYLPRHKTEETTKELSINVSSIKGKFVDLENKLKRCITTLAKSNKQEIEAISFVEENFKKTAIIKDKNNPANNFACEIKNESTVSFRSLAEKANFAFIEPALQFAKLEKNSGNKLSIIPFAEDEPRLIHLLQELYGKEDKDGLGFNITALKLKGGQVSEADFMRITKVAKEGLSLKKKDISDIGSKF